MLWSIAHVRHQFYIRIIFGLLIHVRCIEVKCTEHNHSKSFQMHLIRLYLGFFAVPLLNLLWSRLSRSVKLWQRYPQAIFETVDLSRIKHNHSKGFKFYNIFSDFFKCLTKECNYFHYIYCLIKFYAKLIEAARASNGTQKIGKNLNVTKDRWTNHEQRWYNHDT